MSTVRTAWRRAPVFCFDVEARPGPWGGGDFTWKSMLSIAGSLDGEVSYLGPGFKPKALERFVRPIRDGALIVTHNGPKYDLPFLNGTLMKMGLRPLPPLLVSDTYAHVPRRGQAFSASLGNMARRFGVQAKGSMSEWDWEQVYSGDKAALERLRDYNIGDVLTTLELRDRLIGLGLLGPAKRWKP